MMHVELELPESMSGRRIIRTSAAKDGSENCRHFNIWRDAAEGKSSNLIFGKGRM